LLESIEAGELTRPKANGFTLSALVCLVGRLQFFPRLQRLGSDLEDSIRPFTEDRGQLRGIGNLASFGRGGDQLDLFQDLNEKSVDRLFLLSMGFERLLDQGCDCVRSNMAANQIRPKDGRQDAFGYFIGKLARLLVSVHVTTVAQQGLALSSTGAETSRLQTVDSSASSRA